MIWKYETQGLVWCSVKGCKRTETSGIYASVCIGLSAQVLLVEGQVSGRLILGSCHCVCILTLFYGLIVYVGRPSGPVVRPPIHWTNGFWRPRLWAGPDSYNVLNSRGLTHKKGKEKNCSFLLLFSESVL